MNSNEILEIIVECDSEAAEAVSELFNRYNGGGYLADNESGETTCGGAVVEITGLDDFGRPVEGKYKVVVKTYIKPGESGERIRKRIEEGLWHLRQIYPIPEPRFRTMREQDWAHAWKKQYKPLRIGKHIVLKPTWEEYDAKSDDIVIELDPGMAFGTGLHPSTRLSVIALEQIVTPGDTVLDVGVGSGVLSIVAAEMGATCITATDIDPVAVDVAVQNLRLNGYSVSASDSVINVVQGSVPENQAGEYDIVVANILAEILVKLLDSDYGNVPLAEPLKVGGRIIMAGIINERASMVIEAADRHELSLIEKRQEGDWVALIFEKLPVLRGYVAM